MAIDKDDTFLIGVTGGIASGKSTVIKYLSQKGYSIIEADKLGHQILEPKNPGYKIVVEKFGDKILDPSGKINRQILGRIVFSNPEKLKQLNDISHPAISQMIKKEYKRLASSSLEGIVFLEAALLIETNWYKLCDQIWVVMLEPFIAMQRLQVRDGLTKKEAESRLESQISPDLRKEYADVVICNDNTSDDLIFQTDAALKKLNSSKHLGIF